MELTLRSLCEQTMFPQASEDFADMGNVRGGIGRIDKQVIEVDDNTDIEKVSEYIVHKTLEDTGSVRETKWHNEPFK